MDDLATIYEAVKGDEHARVLVDSLAVRAGLAWRCPRCPWANRIGSGTCGGCGCREPFNQVAAMREP